MAVDLDDTAHCPIDRQCELCGSTERITDRCTATTRLGVLCVELCEDCAAAGKLPRRSASETARAVGQHCVHLGIDLDQMGAAMAAEQA